MQISQAESLVMNELWSRGLGTSEDLVESLGQSQGWHESTIKTLLSRLLKKGAIEAERDGKRYLYRPLLKQGEWKLEESKSLIDRLFGGRLAPLVAHFGEHGEISRQDIDELRQLIERMDRER